MKNHQINKSGFINSKFLKIVGGLLTVSSAMLSSPLMAADISFSGDATTILRMKTNTDKKDIYPLYEYLRFDLTHNRSDGSGVSFYLGTWGRLDLADKTTDKNSDADLQYAFLSYRGAKNNLAVNFGRQFVSEGVAVEKLDGLYLRSDFAAGFAGAAYAGKSVVTEPNNIGGNFVYGGRVTHSMPKYYTVGVSVLKSETENRSSYREEVGLDLWLHPVKMVDLSGRSSYNSLTEGWMEHSYTASITPLDKLRISLDVSSINYKDYFFNMTTNIFKLDPLIIDPNEELTSMGVMASYIPIKNLTVSADYKSYSYKNAGDADYYGGKATYSLPGFAAGFGMHRMEGNVDKLRYTETRVFATKKIGKTDMTADFNNVSYDRKINNISNSYVITGSAGYEINEKLKLGASLDYSKSPDFDNEVRGLIKVIYAFDTKRAEGGGKREK